MSFVADSLEKELQRACEELVERKHLYVFLALFVAGSLAGFLAKVPYLAAPGVALMIASWYFYSKVLKEKEESLIEVWGGIEAIRELEVKMLHSPEERKEIEKEIENKKRRVRKALKFFQSKGEDWRKELTKFMALYGLGAGLAAGSLSSDMPKPFNAVAFVVFSFALLSPVPSLIFKLTEHVPRRG